MVAWIDGADGEVLFVKSSRQLQPRRRVLPRVWPAHDLGRFGAVTGCRSQHQSVTAPRDPGPAAPCSRHGGQTTTVGIAARDFAAVHADRGWPNRTRRCWAGPHTWYSRSGVEEPDPSRAAFARWQGPHAPGLS
jgi:hypothetical protein